MKKKDNLKIELDEKDIKDLYKDKKRLEHQVEIMVRRQKTHLHDYFTGGSFKFGIVGDTQMGSIHENLNLLWESYNVFKKEGVNIVYHTGDLIDGEKMHRGQEYEIYVHGADAQVKNCVDKYPKIKGLETFFIFGNHDDSFKRQSGSIELIAHEIEAKRPDMHYMGLRSAKIDLKVGKGKVRLELVHPGKGTAYALSYHPQKLVEAMTSGEKPHILLIGHYHKTEWLPQYRNVEAFQTGCMQHQTPFMKNMNLAAHQGFWILEGKVNKGTLTRLKGEWFPHYTNGK